MKYLTTNYFLAAATLCRFSSATALGRNLEHYGHYHFHQSPSASNSDSAISTPSSSSVILQASLSSSASDSAPTSTELATSPVVTVAAVVTSTSSSASTSSTNSLSPNGVKAGLSGYVGVQNKPGFTLLAGNISWYSDYSPTTPDSGSVLGIPMLWGVASSCTAGSSRLSAFQSSVSTTKPKYMFGFYEPDYHCPDSSNIDPTAGTAAWNTLIAPLAGTGTILGSPSMATQKDEKWLTPFSVNNVTGASLLDAHWDVTSIHINKLNLTGVQADIEYYVAKYQKPVWVSEFACVDDKDWSPCTNQADIDNFLKSVVPYLQANESVVAYGPSNGNGLGDVWPLFNTKTGELSATGTTYLNILKGF